MHKKTWHSCFAILMSSVLFFCTVLQVNASALPENTAASSKIISSYEASIAGLDESKLTAKEVRIAANTISGTSENGVSVNETILGQNGAVVFEQDETYGEWVFTVNQAGYYRIKIEYCPTKGRQSDIQMMLYINGEIPFDSNNLFVLPRRYKDSDNIRKDNFGNEMRSVKEEVFEWVEKPLKDKDGIYSEPYYFYFPEGENRVQLKIIAAHVALKSITLYSEPEKKYYSEYLSEKIKEHGDLQLQEETIFVAGETPYRTSHTVLYPTYDRQSSITRSWDNTLNDPAKLRLNTFGQSTWKNAGQTISWQFNIKKSGFYQIGMRVRQNTARGVTSTRRVIIDDELLFRELSKIEVPYSPVWQVKVLGDDEPFLFYLDEGTHTIEMEVIAGKAGTYIQRLREITLELNSIYRKIIMITGISPDLYRDYKLEKEIPGLIDNMQKYADELRIIKSELESGILQKGSDAVVTEQLANQLDSFVKTPRTLPSRLSNFQDNISSLSSWVLSLTEQPLEVDYIFINSPSSDLPKANDSWIESILFRIRVFASSFTEDYYVLSDDSVAQEDALNVWVSLGRDQAQIIKDLTDNFFTPQNDIPVNISLVQQGIVEAIAAGKGPNILLYGGDVINLAARNALVDLSQFENFDTIKGWFSDNAFTPLTYEGGVYGLPLQQSFHMLFYRSDIFEELKIKPPKTWDEFYKVIKVIQKNKLTVALPVGTSTSADNSMFETLLYQRGGSYYNDNFSATNFDGETALDAFKQWTEFYTKYNFPHSFSFLNRFRSGELPMAVQDYTAYNLLTVAAPEIRGLWEMTTLPATIHSDGSMSNISTSGISPCIMLQNTKNKKAAFAYMSWFASADIQTQFGLMSENVLGSGARYNPANAAAFENMNWSSAELKTLMAQYRNTMPTTIIPASYYVTRNLSNAFRAVTIKGENAREALYSYNIDINAEITRKRQELGIE